MPVHSRGDKKETNHHDEMEVDYAENEGSSSEDEDTESSSVSEDGDSSGVLLSWAGMPAPLRRAHDRPRRSRRAVRPAASTGRGDGEGAGTDSASGTRSCGAPGAPAPAPGGLGARRLWRPEAILSTLGARPRVTSQYPGATDSGVECPAGWSGRLEMSLNSYHRPLY